MQNQYFSLACQDELRIPNNRSFVLASCPLTRRRYLRLPELLVGRDLHRPLEHSLTDHRVLPPVRHLQRISGFESKENIYPIG